MKFSDTLDYPMPADAVEEMSLDPAFIRSRFARFASGLDVNVDGRKVTARAQIDTGLLPQAAKAVVRGDLVAVFTEEWSGEGAARRARTTLRTEGAPVELAIDSTVSGESTATRRASGELRVAVPFFGSRIEKEAVERASLVLKAEEGLARQWLAARA